jgi:hypothetical protein
MAVVWADVAQPLVAGLGGMLGVYVLEEGLRVLRVRRLCPARWSRDR